MTKQRKGKPTSDNKSLLQPSNAQNESTEKPLIEISEEEQWRLINESGVLKSIPQPGRTTGADPTDDGGQGGASFGEEVLDTILYVVPFSFLLLMMEILMHYQYNRQPTFGELRDRMISSVPILAILNFYTLRHKSYRVLQILHFAVSILSGCRLIYQINNANWLTNMKQCPPLATIWIYTIFMSDLGPAVLSLLTVASFVWWKDLRIIL